MQAIEKIHCVLKAEKWDLDLFVQTAIYEIWTLLHSRLYLCALLRSSIYLCEMNGVHVQDQEYEFVRSIVSTSEKIDSAQLWFQDLQLGDQ